MKPYVPPMMRPRAERPCEWRVRIDWTEPSYVFTHEGPYGGEAMRKIDAFTLPDGAKLDDVMDIGLQWIAEVHAYEDTLH